MVPQAAELERLAVPVGQGEVRGLCGGQRTSARLWPKRPQVLGCVVHEGHPEPLRDDFRGQRAVGQRHAPDVLARSLRLDGPAGPLFELPRIDVEARQDHETRRLAEGIAPRAPGYGPRDE